MQINNDFHFKCIHNTWIRSHQSLHYVYQHFSTSVMRTHRGMPAVAKRYAKKKKNEQIIQIKTYKTRKLGADTS